MIKIYSSNLETSFQLAFDLYDFSNRGSITKEDIRLILSYAPINEAEKDLTKAKEGKFTSGIGAEISFTDRLESQEAIFQLIDKIFEGKEYLDFTEFKRINQEITSETLLCI